MQAAGSKFGDVANGGSAEVTISYTTTLAVVSHFRVLQKGRRLIAHRSLANASGVLGFELYAGRHQLTRRLIAVHHSRSYVYRTRYAGKGPFRLSAVRRNGHSVSIRSR